jgi:hypothetical protein
VRALVRRALAVAALAVSIFAASHGPVDGGRYGAGGGAVCGTDGQCAAYAADHPTFHAVDHATVSDDDDETAR